MVDAAGAVVLVAESGASVVVGLESDGVQPAPNSATTARAATRFLVEHLMLEAYAVITRALPYPDTYRVR